MSAVGLSQHADEPAVSTRFSWHRISSAKAGVHPKQIQALLGHSSITTTLDRYGHLLPGMDEALAERMDGVGRAASA